MYSKQGFTLIEIIVVVIIIGILASIALPKYQKTVEKARLAEAIRLLKHIREAQLIYHTKYSAYANSIDNLPEVDSTNIDNDSRYFTSFWAVNGSSPGFGGVIGVCQREDYQLNKNDFGLYYVLIYDNGSFSSIGSPNNNINNLLP